MIRLMGLVNLKSVGLSKHNINEDDSQAPETPPDNIQSYETPEGDGAQESGMAKADLMSIQKKAAELFNMIGDNEGLEGWVQEKISLAADYINSVHSHMDYEKNKSNTIGNGEGTPADTVTPEPQMKEGVVNEKWAGDADIKSTGEHSDKSVDQLKSQLSSLKKQSQSYQDRGEKVPEDIKKKEKQLLFAIRAKGGWKKGSGATDESAPEGWEGTVKAMKKHKEIDNPWALAHYMKSKGAKSHKKD